MIEKFHTIVVDDSPFEYPAFRSSTLFEEHLDSSQIKMLLRTPKTGEFCRHVGSSVLWDSGTLSL